METNANTVTLNRIEARIEARMMALAAEGLHVSTVADVIRRMPPLSQETDDLWRANAGVRARSLMQRWKRRGKIVPGRERGVWMRPNCVEKHR